MKSRSATPSWRSVLLHCVDPMADPAFSITPARSAADIEAAAQLFVAYAASLGIDLDFQDFGAELASLPGKYARRRVSCCWRVTVRARRWDASGCGRWRRTGAAR
jgi:hypothetical protein